MASSPDELRELRAAVDALNQQVASLTARIYRLENPGAAATVAEPLVAAAVEAPAPAAPIAAADASADAVAPPPPPPRAEGLESRIGQRWFNRIGIVAVLIGVSYFLKYAFDNNWVGPAGRITIGLLAGIGVVLWSERFRRRGYALFSYSLKAVGIGVLYLSLWAAFQVYHLFPAGVAFTAMIVVTAATAAMALSQNAQVLAAMALAGGFATPLLVSTGENHEIALFTYVTVLDLGVLALVVLRPWRWLLTGSFTGTFLLYVGWCVSYYTTEQIRPTLAFASVFFAIFALAPLLSTREELPDGERSEPLVILLVLPLLNASVYFMQVYVAVPVEHRSMTAWYAVALGALYIALSRTGRRDLKPDDRELLRLLHLGLAVAFLTTAIPLKAHGHWITIGWLIEAGMLLWTSQRTRIALLRYMGIGALVLGIARLVFYDYFATERLMFNARFATYAVAIAVLALLIKFGGDAGAGKAQLRIASVVLNLLALIALSEEVSDAFRRAQIDQANYYEVWHRLQTARNFAFSALWMAYGAALMVVGFWKRSAFVRWQALVLLALTVAKVFLSDVSQLDRLYRILAFMVLGVLLLAISFAYQRDWLKLSGRPAPKAADEAKA